MGSPEKMQERGIIERKKDLQKGNRNYRKVKYFLKLKFKIMGSPQKMQERGIIERKKELQKGNRNYRKVKYFL